MMIPGAWEARPRSAAVVEPLTPGPGRPAGRPGRDEPAAETQSAELPAWLKVSIFAVVLLAAMWLVMAMFF
jgi:hypothetical protein